MSENQIDLTLCCSYPIEREANNRCVIMWNEYNHVVQCHNCGEVYTPAGTKMDSKASNDR